MAPILSLLFSLLLINPSNALWKGKTVQPGQFPASVALGTRGNICSGALISSTKAITTASCVDYPGIALDPIFLQNEGPNHPRMIKVKQFVKHPKYEQGVVANDIAVILLESTVDWVGHAHLPSNKTALPKRSKKLDVVAWGDSRDSPQYAEEIMGSFSSCSSGYSDMAPDQSTNFCSYSAHACNGDVGGMVINHETKELIGLIGSMERCQRTDAYEINVAVAPFVDWIESIN